MTAGNNLSLIDQSLVLKPLLRDRIAIAGLVDGECAKAPDSMKQELGSLGVTLREQAGFTRADGTTGKIFEGLFQTDLVETVFNGDRGVANDNSPIGRLRRTS